MKCEFCQYSFDDSLGRHGCPNGLGEGLEGDVVADEQGSRLLMEVFNRMTLKQRAEVPEDLAHEIGDFMYVNGYNFVFDRWYLQAAPGRNPVK